MKSTAQRLFLWGALLTWLFVFALSTLGRCAKDADVVQAEVYASYEKIHPGDAFQIAVVVTIKQGCHINSHTSGDPSVIPTTVSFDESKGIAFSPASYPVPKDKFFSWSTNKRPVYTGEISILCRGRISEDMAPADIQIHGKLTYQACTERTCFLPKTQPFDIPLRVVAHTEPIKPINQHLFQRKAPLSSEVTHAKEVIDKGLAYAVIAFFLFGLALNLTPCVYPVIPLTVGFFASQSEQKKGRLFLLASYYLVGIATVFSVMGLISALAGKQWGFLFQNPWFVIAIVIVILSMAASMFGAFEFTVPSFLTTGLGPSRRGMVGSFIMGSTIGVVIAPCAAGIVIGLAGVVARLGMVAKGTLLFFVMGLGLGTPYLFLAMSSRLLSGLPKSGMWMVWTRKLFGLLLIGVAFYFLVPQAKQSHEQLQFYLGVLALFGGLFLGFLEQGQGYGRAFKMTRGLLGCLIILGGALLIHTSMKPRASLIDWVPYRNQSMTSLQRAKRPILLDFYADWCAACRKLDRKAFTNKKVAEKASQFTMVRVDCTTPDDKTRLLVERFGVSGLPTIVFLSAQGEEFPGLRIVGFAGPKELLKRMEKAARRRAKPRPKAIE